MQADQVDLIEEADPVMPHHQLHRALRRNKHSLPVTQAQRISALEEQVHSILS